MKKLLLILLVSFSGPLFGQSVNPKPAIILPPADAQLKQRFVEIVGDLASDEFEGRASRTKGDTLATRYICQEFKKIDGVTLLGNDGLQEVLLSGPRVVVADSTSLSVGDKTFVLGADYYPCTWSSSGVASGEVVSIGYGTPEDFKGKILKGKIVLLDAVPAKGGKELDLIDRMINAEIAEVGGVVIVEDKLNLNQKNTSILSKKLLICYVTPKVATAIKNSKEMSFNITLNNTKAYTFNVVAKLSAPKDNNPKGESMIIGGHYDHLGVANVNGERVINYGADDNASGVAAVIEFARYLSERREFLQRDIIFIAFGAEEIGLRGSAFYANNPLEPLESVKTMINFDMLGRMSGKGITIRGLGSAADAPMLLGTLPNPDRLDLIWEMREQGPTDYGSFYAKGIPSFSFSTRLHPDYHSPRDTKEKVNYDGMVLAFRYIQNLVNRFAFEPLVLNYKKVE